MIRKFVPAALLGFALGTCAQPSWAADDQAGADNKGDWNLDLRYRLELVDQDPLAKDATASTLRARLNYKTADYGGWSAFAEVDYVAAIIADDYNEGGGNSPDKGRYPVVADPEGEDVNQAFLQYKSGGNQFRVGRQRIIFDNARFVGNVGWRQNPQTYDAVSYGLASSNGTAFTVAYVDHVNRIFGSDVAAGDHENSTWLLNFGKPFAGGHELSVYYYDIDNDDAAAFSSTTRGARYSGKHEEAGLGYTIEYARQEDNADNPTPYEADYFRLDLSVGVGRATLYGGFESLEGDHTASGKAFRTPLATLHAFNGWADKFLVTPGAGLEDVFLGARGKLGEWSWNIVYHDFAAQSGSGDFGSEFDASISRKLGDGYGLLLKAANFSTDSPAYGDTTKIWLQLTAGF